MWLLFVMLREKQGGIQVAGTMEHDITDPICCHFDRRGRRDSLQVDSTCPAGKEQIKKNTDEIEKIKRKQDNDLERFGRDEAYLQAICQMQLVMINHMIDGNHIEQMRETRDRITDLMVKM